MSLSKVMTSNTGVEGDVEGDDDYNIEYHGDYDVDHIKKGLEEEIDSIRRWYNVRREHILKELQYLEERYKEMISELIVNKISIDEPYNEMLSDYILKKLQSAESEHPSDYLCHLIHTNNLCESNDGILPIPALKRNTAIHVPNRK